MAGQQHVALLKLALNSVVIFKKLIRGETWGCAAEAARSNWPTQSANISSGDVAIASRRGAKEGGGPFERIEGGVATTRAVRLVDSRLRGGGSFFFG
jgi:hypothetical protein